MRSTIFGLVTLLGLAACSKQESQSPASQGQAPAGKAAEPESESPSQEVNSADEEETKTPSSPAAKRRKSTTPPQAGPSSLDETETKKGEKDLLASEPRTLEQAQAQLRQAETQLKEIYKSRAQPLASGDSRCTKACKAFASLKRAKDAICRLTKKGSEACEKANSSVKANEKRLKACACE